MNNEKQQRLDKLTAEYSDLNGKISRLDNFINRLDFETMVPDFEEQMLMQHQLTAMRSYRTNLKERIQFLQAQIQAGSPCDDRVVTSATHHCGQDAVNFEQLSDNLTDTYKDYCRGVFEQFLSREITWAKFVEKVALPFCHENVNEFVNAIKEGRSHCSQDASCPVGGGSAAVITGDSLKYLLGMEVISVGDMPCDACNPDNYAGRPCVKVELVGGTYLCLAPQPGSIITE